LRNRLGLIYGILVTLILLIGFWWVFFLVREGENYEKLQFQRHQTDIATAYYMFETSSRSIDAYQSMLEQHFPHLQLKMTGDGLTIVVDPEIHRAVHQESIRKKTDVCYRRYIFYFAVTCRDIDFDSGSKTRKRFQKSP